MMETDVELHLCHINMQLMRIVTMMMKLHAFKTRLYIEDWRSN